MIGNGRHRAFLSLAMCTCAWGCASYSPDQYRGDGQVVGCGSEGRYCICFPNIDLTRSGIHRFCFSGAPPGRIRVFLDADESVLTDRSTSCTGTIRVRLRNAVGRTLLDYSASPAHWPLISPIRTGPAVDLKVQASEPIGLQVHGRYTLLIEVQAPDDPRCPPIFATPIVWYPQP